MAVGTKWRVALLAVCAAIKIADVMASQEVMKNVSVGFGRALNTCRVELGIGDHIMQDFYNYWREEYALVNRDLGCMVMCMASKLDLIGEDDKMHHGNAHAFAKTHGADDDVAKQIVAILADCDTTHSKVDDPCDRALEVAKCFRQKIHDLKWAPSMEVILEELMIKQ